MKLVHQMKAPYKSMHRLALATKAACSASILASVAIGTSVYAQDTLEEVLVTAQFREASLQSTPIAITAVTGDQIENKAMNSVVDIAATAPNVNIQAGSNAYGSGATVYIRGVGQYDTNFAFEPGVGVYVDDVYHGVIAGSIFDLLDLDRVEILRGPQGTLAGRNSIGGAMKLYSRKAEGSGNGYVSVTGGNFDRLDMRGAYDVALNDQLNMRVSGFSKSRDGHVTRLDFACAHPTQAGTLPNNRASLDDCKIGTLGAIDSKGGRVVFDWQPSEDVNVMLSAMMIRDDSEAAGAEQTFADQSAFPPFLQTPPYQGVTYDSRFVTTGTYTNYADFTNPRTGYTMNPEASTHMDAYSARVVWDISDNLQLTSITAYTDMETNWSGDNDGSPMLIGLTSNFSPYEQTTQELRLSGIMTDANIDWTIGGFWFDSSGRVAANVQNLGFLQNDPVDSESSAYFAHAVWGVTDALNITAGVRRTEDDKSYKEFVRVLPNGTVAPPPFGLIHGLDGSFSGSQTDWRLGADYTFNDNVMGYVNLSTGYKGGGINPRPFVASQVVPFKPETVDAREIGVKADLLDNTLRINAAYFMNDYTDIILIDANGFPGAPGDPDYFFLSAAPFNAGDADISGLEVEVVYEPGNGFSLTGSWSTLDFEYQTLDTNATASGIGKNSIAPFTPENKYSLQLAYEFNTSSGAKVRPQLYMNYMDSVYTDPVNSPRNKLEDYRLVNANISYETSDGSWEFIAGVTNLSDEHYNTNAFDLSTINGTVQTNVGRPREYFVTARRSF